MKEIFVILPPKMDTIGIVDFGSQYAHLIANRVRRLGSYSEVILPETPVENFKKFKGIILSGGPQSVYGEGAPTINAGVLGLGIPVLGLCYGHQLISFLLGGKVTPGTTKEYGLATFSLEKSVGIFKGIRKTSQVWMSHGDAVSELPQGFICLGKTDDCAIAAAGNPEKNIYSTQFHVEVAHTEEGMKILDNFLNICDVSREWNTKLFLKNKMKDVKKLIGNRKVFLLVSGGVDSTVAYALLSKTLGSDNVYGLFIDTGFLRRNEGKIIEKALTRLGFANFHSHSAGSEFFAALKGVINPEEKRKIIGDLFLKVQADAIKKLGLNPEEWVLGQGTIYPDTIESAGTKHSDKIKTHHNRVPEILALIEQGKVIEPLAELYKDEVRELGKELGLPDEIVWKHPFPGPGLAVRILCSQGEDLSNTLSDADNKINEFLTKDGLKGKILPIQSVGVQGDARTYRHPLVVWGNQSNFDDLEKISTDLTNRFFDINRVCLLLDHAEIVSVHAFPAKLTRKRVKLLQKLDYIVMKFVKKHKLMRQMWQFPSVLIPVEINGKKCDALVLRPVCSLEAMTAQFYKMDVKLMKDLAAKLTEYVSAVLYDITNKPPATIEWE